MLARRVAQSLESRGIHYAWVVVAVTFLTMLTSAAALGLPGLLMQPMAAEFGWRTEQISSAIAIRFLLFGLMGPFAAILMARYGLKRIVTLALLLVSAGMLLSTGITDIWQLLLLWGLMLGVGTGMTALVLGTIIANRWFDARRGLVLGLLTASTATGQLIFLPVAAWLVESQGWRAAILPVVMACLFVAGLVVLFLRDRPEALGLTAYGSDPLARPLSPAPAADIGFMAPLRILRSVSGNRVFWILFGTFFICGLSTSGLIQTHFISLCGDYGLSAIPAASVLAMMGAFDFVGTILSGWLSDRYDNRKLLFWYYGLRGLSLFWLPHSEFTFYGLSLFAMFYGLDWIATVPPTARLAANAFGRERAAVVFGWIFAGHQIGSAAAAYGAGASRTWLLSYTPALYLAGALCLLAAGMIMLLEKERPATAGT